MYGPHAHTCTDARTHAYAGPHSRGHAWGRDVFRPRERGVREGGEGEGERERERERERGRERERPGLLCTLSSMQMAEL
jgi:hypothetical protein